MYAIDELVPLNTLNVSAEVTSLDMANVEPIALTVDVKQIGEAIATSTKNAIDVMSKAFDDKMQLLNTTQKSFT